MIGERRDGIVHGGVEMLPGLRVPVQPPVIPPLKAQVGQAGLPQIGVLAVVDHVLKDDHAKTVTVVVKLLRLDLDVLAQGVEAQTLHGADVPGEGGGACRGVEPVAPVALVQKTVEEIGLAVETEAGDAVHGLGAEGAESKIGLHPVLTGGECKGIEMRILRTPENGRINR